MRSEEVLKMGGKRWTEKEIKLLKIIYRTYTIKEILELNPTRTEDAINSQILRLRKMGEIRRYKDNETKTRAMKERDLRRKRGVVKMEF
jgi:hypothetical protein